MNTGRRSPWILGILPLLALTAGCERRLDDGAREVFSRAFSCPAEHIELSPRADLAPWDVVFPPTSPPDEVVQDPARRAIWDKNQRQDQAAWNKDRKVYEVRGCDHAVLYSCDHPVTPDGATLIGTVECTLGDYPLGTRSRW